MSGIAGKFEILPFRKSYAKEVRKIAEKSWYHTYRDIYPRTEISEFISTNYDVKNLALLQRYVEEGTISLNLAFSNGKPIGFCHVGKKQEFELLRIYVLPRWIGHGAGKELLHEGERWILASRGTEYITRVQKRNTLGIRFYERSGFTRDESLDRDDQLCYRKQLQPDLIFSGRSKRNFS